MLCPEVINFSAPDSILATTKRATTNNNDDHVTRSTINNFPYSHLVSVTLPDISSTSIPASLIELLISDCEYYKVSNLSLDVLVNKDFIDSFIKSGNLLLLNINCRIDCDNCVAITPDGCLVLSLTKATYQSLGLEGHLSHFHTRTKERYIVKINLKADHFKPGKSNYDRTKQCLEKLRDFTIIVTWEPPPRSSNDDADICPSSVAEYFHKLGHNVNLCEINFTQNTCNPIKVPNNSEIVDMDDHALIIEWLGMIALEHQICHEGAPNDYLSTYETPEPNKSGQVTYLQWRGFFTQNQIQRFWNRLKEFAKLNGIINKSWVSMYVQGFSDSPVAWNDDNEHHYYTNGDNGYVFVQDGDKCLITLQKCSNKRYSIK